MSAVIVRGVLMSVVAVLIGLAPSPSDAVNDLGQVCIALTPPPSGDIVRVGLTQTIGSATLIAANFRWRSGSVQVVGTGTLTNSLATPGGFDMALTGMHNNAVSTGGNKICSLFFVLTPPSFGGPWQFTCVGSGGAPFTNTGTMTFVPCTASDDAATTAPGLLE